MAPFCKWQIKGHSDEPEESQSTAAAFNFVADQAIKAERPDTDEMIMEMEKSVRKFNIWRRLMPSSTRGWF